MYIIFKDRHRLRFSSFLNLNFVFTREILSSDKIAKKKTKLISSREAFFQFNGNLRFSQEIKGNFLTSTTRSISSCCCVFFLFIHLPCCVLLWSAANTSLLSKQINIAKVSEREREIVDWKFMQLVWLFARFFLFLLLLRHCFSSKQ
jgi:hypothetical protein